MSKLSLAQRVLLDRIDRHGLKLPVSDKPGKTLASLLRRGLVRETYTGPLPGNDYGGSLIYTLTAAGREALR